MLDGVCSKGTHVHPPLRYKLIGAFCIQGDILENLNCEFYFLGYGRIPHMCSMKRNGFHIWFERNLHCIVHILGELVRQEPQGCCFVKNLWLLLQEFCFTAPDLHCNNIGICTVTSVLHTMGVSNHETNPKIILFFNGEYERVHQFLEDLEGFPLGNS